MDSNSTLPAKTRETPDSWQTVFDALTQVRNDCRTDKTTGVVAVQFEVYQGGVTKVRVQTDTLYGKRKD